MRTTAYTLFVVICFSLSCSFDKPQAPSWDLTLNLPLTEQSITMADVVEDYSHIFTDADGLLGITFDGSIDTTRFIDNLAVPEFSTQYQLSLPELHFPSLPLGTSIYLMEDIYPGAAAMDNIIIPQYTFTELPCNSGDSDYFKYIMVDNGTIRLTITNNFPLELNDLTFHFVDPNQPGSDIFSPVLSTLAAFSTDQIYIKIEDKPFSHNGGWTISGKTPGTHGERISLSQDNSLSVQTDLTQFSVSMLDSKIPSVEIEDLHQVELNSDYWVEKMAFRRGHLNLHYQNTMQLGAEMQLMLECFHHKTTDEPLIIPVSFAAHSSSQKVIDLKNYVLDLSNEDQEILQVIPVRFLAITKDASNDFVAIQKADGLSFKFNLDDVDVEYVTGRFPEQEFELPKMERLINLPEEFEKFKGLNVAEAVLQLDVFNRMHLPFQFKGSLCGYSKDGRMCDIQVDESIQPAVGLLEKANHLPMFNTENSNIAGLMNLPPERIVIGGVVRVGDESERGTLRYDDYIRAAFEFRAPAHLSWQKTTLTTDTNELHITPEEYQSVNTDDSVMELEAEHANRIQGFTVKTIVENHLPVGGKVNIRFATNESRLTTNPDIELKDIEVQAAPVNSEGIVQKTNVQEIEIELSDTEAEIFHNESGSLKKVFIASEFTLNGTNGQKVKFYNSDYLKLSAIAQLCLRIEK